MERYVETFFQVVYVLLVVVLGGATIVENSLGTHFVETYVYGHSCFFMLCFLFFLAAAYLAIRKQVWKNIPSLLMHLSFFLVFLGSFLTYAIGERGFAHVVKGEQCAFFEDKEGERRSFPFALELDSFCVRYYPGTEAPMDYVSYLRLDGEPTVVSMNHNLVKEGYRFCQSSFDEEGQGTWLSVNHDRYGVSLVFAGYLLFAVAGLLSFFWRGGRFRQLLSHPLLRKGSFLILLILMGTPFVKAESLDEEPQRGVAVDSSGSYDKTGKVPVLSKDEALALRSMQCVYQNRIVPFNTVAIDFVKKITGKANYQGLMPEQVLGGWSYAPKVWSKEKMIKVKSAELRQLLGMTGDYCSLSDLYDEKGVYRLQTIWARELTDPHKSKLEKAISELDEKVGIIFMLQQGTLCQPLPKDGSVQPLSDMKVSAELLYNRLPLTKVLFMVNLTLGLLSFLFFHLCGVSGNRGKGRWMECVPRILPWVMILVLLVQMVGYALRWYISGRMPLNNGYETMQFLSICVMAISLLACRKYRFVLSFGFLLSGFVLLVSHLGEMNPQITPLMPVLNSPWLSIHVSMIMMSYALFAFIMLNSLWALLLMRRENHEIQVEQLTLINRILVYPATFLIGVGITLGSVWANESWGNYWGWDPKEVWALVTFLVYGAVIVFPQARIFTERRWFHVYLLLAFLTVLMTYFGVNYLLGGMHSYANQ
ncbi:MAG: cytochrome c biogenesis protein CcsA [Paludibacteraceae bacterium]|nr:cytochrome c biogenesis protein CcsA [Paludibacteraceae bacterium]